MEARLHNPIELFFSYSHRDDDLRNELEKHLTLLRRQGIIAGWHDRKISAGTEWAGAIDSHAERADIILLLVSADFLHSDYCYDIEMKRALDRQSTGHARVVPIILRAVDWAGAPFGGLQALPTDARPVTSWANRDEAFTDVARGIRRLVAELRPPDGPARRRSDYFIAQHHLIAEHARRFVGRADSVRTLDRFLSTRPRGYFIIRGGPGQGKTTLLAHLVKERRYVHHFISRSGGRSDVRLILSSLLAQLPASSDAPPSGAALPELAKAFDEGLARSAASYGDPFVIAIDAMDELTAGPGEEAAFLPADTLPPNAFVLVTSRPGPRIDALQERMYDMPSHTCELRALDPAESLQVVNQNAPELSEADRDRVVRAATGNPLYLQTALTALQSEAPPGTSELPPALEGYYRHATRNLPATSPLRDVLGILSVVRQPLGARHLARILGRTEQDTHREGLQGIRQFLRESESGLTFYHEHFRDFVIRELFCPEELRPYHERVADWLMAGAPAADDYAMRSLAFHLYESGNRERLARTVDSAFLARKVRRMGYAVLDDVEILTKAFLEANDPALVERCVSLVESLRKVVGSDVIEDAADALQFGVATGREGRRAIAAPRLPSIPAVDLYAGFLPKGSISADFVESVPKGDRLLVAIGDAPSTGIKSAFVARFIANLFGSLVRNSGTSQPADLLRDVRRRISSHRYFDWVSMQCVDIDPARGRIAIANGGHPFPLLYSARRRRWDALPVRGELLNAGDLSSVDPTFQQRHVEIAPGDILILLSDGLTERSARFHDPFGYRFADAVFQQPDRSARQIGESILEAWQRHPRAEDWADDVSVVVAVVRASQDKHS